MYTFDRKKFIMLRIITQILPLLRVLKRQIYLKFVMLVLVLHILDYIDIATKKWHFSIKIGNLGYRTWGILKLTQINAKPSTPILKQNLLYLIFKFLFQKILAHIYASTSTLMLANFCAISRWVLCQTP